jgi:hypothetical protein
MGRRRVRVTETTVFDSPLLDHLPVAKFGKAPVWGTGDFAGSNPAW